jgi:DNA polymerase-1
MIMQVHDELVFDAPEQEYSSISQIISQEMTNSLSLGEVPIVVDIGYGKNWLQSH